MELWRTTFAFVICLFVHAHGEPQCSCFHGCGNNGTTFPGSDGNIVNVAYGKLANMSSVLPNDGESGPACAAVNGRTGTVWMPKSDPNTNCVHTDLYNYDAFWFVDLGRNYTVTDITVYRREGEGGAIRMSGMSVFVDNQLCYSFLNRTTANIAALKALPEQINITCPTPLTGRHVRFQKHGEDSNYDAGAYFINICEVQVWGCSTGYRGVGCRCGHCKDGADCDVATLTCPSGCDKGWGTVFCNQSCTAGTHGYDCGQQCGQCADSDTCNTVTGLCPNGCQPGWKGDTCKQECADGYYGQRCVSRCGNCFDGEVCDKVNGTCPKGCQPGFDPSDRLCKIRCPRMQYGGECALQCGQCQNNAPCDVVTGHCDACLPNLLHPLCQVCEGKMYGAQCDTPCSAQCGGDGSCHRNNGTCQAGCTPGYLLGSGFCEEKCQSGAFGPGCVKKCGNCAESRCNHGNGTCEVGCSDGYVGERCSETSGESSPNLAGPVAGAVFGGLCVIALPLSILVVLLIRRSRKRSSSETASPRQASNDQRIESGPSLELNGQAGPQNETGGAVGTDTEESNFYEGLQTPDDSDRDPYSTPVFKGQQGKGRHSHTYQNPAWHASNTGKDYYNL